MNIDGADARPSSYLAHLPPALWRPDLLIAPAGRADPESPTNLDLGAVLKIFEKVATGIADGVRLAHPVSIGPGHDHGSLTDEISRLHRLFDPWTAPEEFLPWLASWVALEFPTLQGEPLWEEYQRRQVTSGIAPIYRLRGRRAGLNRYLELYAVGHTRPRVTVDDGARLLAVTPQPGAPALVSTLVTQGPVVVDRTVRSEGLTRPWCVTTDQEGGLIVGDIALPGGLPVRLPPRLWRLDGAGRYPLAGTPPRPRPLIPELTTLQEPVGVVVRPASGGGPATLFALTRSGQVFAVPAPFSAGPATLVTKLTAPAGLVWMTSLALDPASGDLLALDRGALPSDPAVPSLIRVRTAPLVVTRTALSGVIEPLSLLVEPAGTLLVGDGRQQEPAAANELTGNLVRVDLGANPVTQTPLLPSDPALNPLVSPTGLARIGSTLYVLDVGLKPFWSSSADPFISPVAEHAAVYRAEPAAAPAALARITVPGTFVHPTGMVAAGDRLVVSDPGQPEVLGVQPFWCRVRPFLFDVAVHFADARLPADPAERKIALDQAVGTISTIVDDQKPAHTLWTLSTSIL